MPGPGRVYADPARERVLTSATIVTAIRTVASVAISAVAAMQGSLTLLCIGLVVHWVGDSLDGLVARVRDCETRTGAVLDILSDRLCAAAFYIGLVWLEPHLGPAVFIYLIEFMVIDGFLSLGFLAWPLTSPNHFHVVDRTLWRFNWSHPGKAVNSGLFAILLVVTSSVWAGLVVAVALLAFKSWSLARLVRLGMPVPGRPSPHETGPQDETAHQDETGRADPLDRLVR